MKYVCGLFVLCVLLFTDARVGAQTDPQQPEPLPYEPVDEATTRLLLMTKALKDPELWREALAEVVLQWDADKAGFRGKSYTELTESEPKGCPKGTVLHILMDIDYQFYLMDEISRRLERVAARMASARLLKVAGDIEISRVPVQLLASQTPSERLLLQLKLDVNTSELPNAVPLPDYLLFDVKPSAAWSHDFNNPDEPAWASAIVVVNFNIQNSVLHGVKLFRMQDSGYVFENHCALARLAATPDSRGGRWLHDQDGNKMDLTTRFPLADESTKHCSYDLMERFMAETKKVFSFRAPCIEQ